MAQRTEKEETEFNIVAEPIMVSPSVVPASIIHLKSPRSASSRSSPAIQLPEKRDLEVATENTVVLVKTSVNRCSGCRKKVGLTGFRCRCGDLFCSHHRYSDRHNCSFDYKSAAREAISRENPVVKAAKIVKI